MMQIQLFDLNSGTRTIIPFKELIPDDILERVKEWGDSVGVGLEVTEIKDAHRFLQHYFSEQGYHILDLQQRFLMSLKDSLQTLEKREIIPREVADAALETGAPDYLCYKEKGKDYFFAEAKNQNDGMRMSQLAWFYNHKCPTKIIHIAEIGSVE